MKVLRSFLVLVARLCLAAIFFSSGINKLMYFDGNAQYMASKGLTNIPLLLIGAAIIELIGSLSIILGYKTRFGALILLIYLIPVTVLFHDFWNISGLDHTLQQIMFFKNLAIFGGLIYILCDGPGGCACDVFGRKKQHDTKLQDVRPIQEKPPEVRS